MWATAASLLCLVTMSKVTRQQWEQFVRLGLHVQGMLPTSWPEQHRIAATTTAASCSAEQTIDIFSCGTLLQRARHTASELALDRQRKRRSRECSMDAKSMLSA